MGKEIDLSIIIVSYNTKDLLVNCVESVIKNTKNINYEIIVVDNGSSDASVEAVRNFKFKISNLKLTQNKDNVGFAKANNQGAEKAKGEYLLFLNSDTLIHDNVLGEMVGWMRENEKIGVASCRLNNSDGSIQENGGYFPTLIRVISWMTIQDLPLVDKFIKPFHPHKEKSVIKDDDFFAKEKEVDWVKGAFLIIKTSLFKQIKGWDSDYFMYTEDTDICFRVKQKGWKVVYNPKWMITHFGGASSKSREFSILQEYKSVKLFYMKHYPKWHFFWLRIVLKLGALLRVPAVTILEGKDAGKIYIKAFNEA